MLTPCKYCLCTVASYEQYMFGYQSAETKHKRMKQIIDICLFNVIKNYNSNWKKNKEEV